MNKAEDYFIKEFIKRFEDVETRLGYGAHINFTRETKYQAAIQEYRSSSFEIHRQLTQERSPKAQIDTENPWTDDISSVDEYLNELARRHEKHLKSIKRNFPIFNLQPVSIINLLIAAYEFKSSSKLLAHLLAFNFKKIKPSDPYITANEAREKMFSAVMQQNLRINGIALLESNMLYRAYQSQNLHFENFIEEIKPQWISFVKSIKQDSKKFSVDLFDVNFPHLDPEMGKLFIRFLQQEKEMSIFIQENLLSMMENIRSASHAVPDTISPSQSMSVDSKSISASSITSSRSQTFSSATSESSITLFKLEQDKLNNRDLLQSTSTELEKQTGNSNINADDEKWKFERQKEFKQFLAKQTDLLNQSNEKTPDIESRERIFTQEQLDFMAHHWRPLRPIGKSTIKFTHFADPDETISPADRFFFEAQLCSVNKHISAYEVNAPALKDNYSGVIVLGKCNIRGAALILEDNHLNGGSKLSVTNFDIPRGQRNFKEGKKFKFSHYYFHRFTGKYNYEFKENGAYYFPDSPKEFMEAWLQKKADPDGKTASKKINADDAQIFLQWNDERRKNPRLENVPPIIEEIECDFQKWIREHQQKYVATMYESFKKNFTALKNKYESAIGNGESLSVDQVISRFTKEQVNKNLAAKKQAIETVIDEVINDPTLKGDWKTKNISPPGNDKVKTTIDAFAFGWDSQKITIKEFGVMLAVKATQRVAFEDRMNQAMAAYEVKKPSKYIETEFRSFLLSTADVIGTYDEFVHRSLATIRSEAINGFNTSETCKHPIPQTFHFAAAEKFDEECRSRVAKNEPTRTFQDFLTTISEKLNEKDTFLKIYRDKASRYKVKQSEQEWKKLFIDYTQQPKPMRKFLEQALIRQAAQQINKAIRDNLKISRWKSSSNKR